MYRTNYWFQASICLTIALMAVLFSLSARAELPNGGQYYPKPGQCVFSIPLHMQVVAKAQPGVYGLAVGSPVLNDMAFVELKSHEAHEGEMLNTGVEYVGSKDVKMPSGFTKTIDKWKECQMPEKHRATLQDLIEYSEKDNAERLAKDKLEHPEVYEDRK